MNSSKWKRSDLASFWGHYNVVRQWPSRMQNDLRRAVSYYYRHNYDQVSTSQDDIDSITENTSAIRLKSQEFVDEFISSSCYETDENEEVLDEGMECEGHIMGNEEDWTPEVAEFVRKTREHRRELAEARAKAAALKKKDKGGELDWVERDCDEFVLAEDIGVYGAKQITTSAPTHNRREAEYQAELRKLYGSNKEKVKQIENAINVNFEQKYKETNAQLWPSIPLRF